MFYTSVITHGYLPLDFMNTICVPLVKNKTGDTSDVDNYRPIALVTIASKIFENVLLDILQTFENMWQSIWLLKGTLHWT